jgi:hypothetical protein
MTRLGKPNKKNIDGKIKMLRLEIRITGTTRKKLQWIRDCSAKYKDMTNSAIIENLIDDHVALQEVFNYAAPRFKA